MLILIERNTERRLLWLASFGGGEGASLIMLSVGVEFKVVNGERVIKKYESFEIAFLLSSLAEV